MVQTGKQNDRINSGSCTINSPSPWELLSSRLFRASVSSRGMTLLWRVLSLSCLFEAAVLQRSRGATCIVSPVVQGCCSPKVFLMAMTYPCQSEVVGRAHAMRRVINSSKYISCPTHFFCGGWIPRASTD